MQDELQLRFDGVHGTYSFHNPLEILRASNQEEAWKILQRAEDALRAGYCIAGSLAYEFGYACVDLPIPQIPTRFPLLLLGIFHTGAHPGEPLSQEKKAAFHSLADFRCTSDFLARISRQEYDAAIHEIRHLLHEGDLYQLNYTVPFDMHFTGSPESLYDRLGAHSQAPHRAFLQTPEFAVVSLSPELFLAFDQEHLRTKPMKGTTLPGHERELAQMKNRAEHLMIVDLLRNDLAQVCRKVEVEKLFHTERYPTFSTMTSTICGIRRAGTTLRDIFRALFPCGSVTGAPKRAAIREIARLESNPRDAYCGSLGYLLPDGRGYWNVAIRSLQLDRLNQLGRLDLGGGIVADSQAEAEWDEILIKGELFSTLASLKWRGTPAKRP